MEPIAWQESGKQPIVGVDNIWITVKHDDEYNAKVVPLLNIGGLVKYKMGKGGIILNQLRVQATEANPVNAEKKQVGTYLSTRIWSFKMHHHCGCEIEVVTDPKTCKYLVPHGAKLKVRAECLAAVAC